MCLFPFFFRLISRSFAGAWIEIFGDAIKYMKRGVAPSRERGLKSCFLVTKKGCEFVVPSRERGLKFYPGPYAHTDEPSLLRGSVK